MNESVAANSHAAEHTKWENELVKPFTPPLFFVPSFFFFIAHLHCRKQEHLKVIHEAQIETLELQAISLRFV